MFSQGEDPQNFESRKADHIRLALSAQTQTTGGSGLNRIRLEHEAFPEIDFEDVSLDTLLFSRTIAVPLFVSSMTAGHAGSGDLNLIMARVSERRGWAMGVGSQRRQLSDQRADLEWSRIRKSCPSVRLFGNIGLAQLVKTSTGDIRRLAETLQAEAMFVHTNPLQECFQPEGTPQFSGGLQALERLVKELSLPVIVKETGCGFSKRTLERLQSTGVAAVDLAGYGGTHWGLVEGGRSRPGEKLQLAAQTFGEWGIPLAESLEMAIRLRPTYDVWASGGIRSGLDAAKCLAMGARMVGLAQPIIESAIAGEETLNARMDLLEYELKTAMFCSGVKTVEQLREKRAWQWAR